jgi:hypothetical protein
MPASSVNLLSAPDAARANPDHNLSPLQKRPYRNAVILSLSKDQFGFPLARRQTELILRQAQDDR